MATISAGAVEGLNNKVKLMTRKAYGFRTINAVKTALFHSLGHCLSQNLPTNSAKEAEIAPGRRGGDGNVPDPGVLRAGHGIRQLRPPGDIPRRQSRAPYAGTGFGQKYRMHPFAAAVLRPQLRDLEKRNTLARQNIRALNDRLVQLPGLREPRCRADQKRVYYSANMLFLDEQKAGFSRDSLVKVQSWPKGRTSVWDYPEQHKLKIYGEAKWWHHPPTIPDHMPGNERVNHTHLFLPLLYGDASELIDQYVSAFEKVWAHRTELTKS